MNRNKLIHWVIACCFRLTNLWYILSLIFTVTIFTICFFSFFIFSFPKKMLALLLDRLVLLCFRFFSHLIVNNLHNFGFSLIYKFVHLLLKLCFIHKLIVVLHRKVPLLYHTNLLLLSIGIFLLIEATRKIIVDNRLYFHLFYRVDHTRINASITLNHRVDLIPEVPPRSTSVLFPMVSEFWWILAEFLLTSIVVPHSLNGLFRR